MDIEKIVNEHLKAVSELREACIADIQRIAEICIQTLAAGHTIYLMGNGGSACDAQHFAAELVGRFQKERRALAAVALTTDTSILTALGNDYGIDIIFSRQVEALVKAGDLVIGISTSGTSVNVVKGLKAAAEIGAVTVGLTGFSGGEMKDLCSLCLSVPSSVTARVQEMHLLVEHIVCQLVEDELMRQGFC